MEVRLFCGVTLNGNICRFSALNVFAADIATFYGMTEQYSTEFRLTSEQITICNVTFCYAVLKTESEGVKGRWMWNTLEFHEGDQSWPCVTMQLKFASNQYICGAVPD